MADIRDKLTDIEKSLEGLVLASGKNLPSSMQRSDIVGHLDYVIDLLGTMVSKDTLKRVLGEAYVQPDNIADKAVVINKLLQSGEISGDIDVESITITEPGVYTPGLGKAYGTVTVDMAVSNEDKIISGTIESLTNNRVNRIASYVFFHAGLTDASFPECSVIEASAFQTCTSLTTVSFPKCSAIETYAFAYCSALSNAYFPTCTSIASNAFYGCEQLSEVDFPTCTRIGSNAFSGCNSLAKVSFPVCESIHTSALCYCSALTDVYFPACTSISSFAFYRCTSLSKASFPECKYIGNNAFQYCNMLTSVYILCSSVPTLMPTGFSNTGLSSSGAIYVKASMLSDFQSNSIWAQYSLVGLTDEEIEALDNN